MASDLDITANLRASFNNSADDYERRTGGCTRAVAKHVCSILLPVPPKAIVLDNACGTLAISEEIIKTSPEAHVHAVDASQGMIDIAKSVIQEHGWQDKIDAEVMDGQALRFADGMFDISMTNFGIAFFPDPAQGAKEIYRTLKPGGRAVVTSWKFVGFLPVFHEAQKIIKPATPMPSSPLETWKEKGTLENTLREGGFTDIKTEEKDVVYKGANPESFMMGMMDMFKSLVGSSWSGKEIDQMPPAIENVLAEQPDKSFFDGDGSRALRMVAWIAMAEK